MITGQSLKCNQVRRKPGCQRHAAWLSRILNGETNPYALRVSACGQTRPVARRSDKSVYGNSSVNGWHRRSILNTYNNFILKEVHEYIHCPELFCIQSGPLWPCSDTRCYRLLSWPHLLG